MKISKIIKMSGLACMLLLMAACGGQTQTSAPQAEPTTEQTPTDITFQLSWIHEYSVAQFHNAEKNGHFADQGLNVTIIEGGFSDAGVISPVEEVVSGNAQFGMGDGSDVLVARQQGKPLVAILSTLHRSPNSIISLEASGIDQPQDLVGKTVAVADGGATLVYNHLLSTLDIDPETINTVPRTTFGIDPLLDGDADAIFGWIINEAVMVEEAGETPSKIALSDYAVDTYNSLIFTTEDMIENHPEQVQAFVNAVLAGMQDILDDSEASVTNTLTYNEELDYDAQLRRLNTMIPLMNTTGLALGTMQPDVWELTHELLLEGDVLEAPLDWESAFTNEFLPENEGSD